MLKKRAMLVLVVLAAFAVAQGQAPEEQEPPSYRILGSSADVALVISMATEELMVTADVMRSEEVAEALRQAMVTRGVPVYIMTLPENVEENASYFASLALAGANVRLSQVQGNFIVVDRRMVVAGPMVAGLALLPGEEANPHAFSEPTGLTVLVDDPNYTAQFVQGFYTGFTAAAEYQPRVGPQ